MALSQAEREQALEAINQMQSSNCAPVNVQIGHVADNGQIQHNSIYITDCPGKIINGLRADGFKVSIDERGAKIYRMD